MIYIFQFYAAQAASVGLVFIVVFGSLFFEKAKAKKDF
jgi:hypothetical protein